MSQHPLGPFHTMTLLAFTFLAAFAWQATAATGARLSESYGKLPLHFEANRGQAHKDVRFLSRGPGYSLYLTSSEAVLVLSRPDADAKRDARSTPVRAEVPSAHAKSVALRMSLVGAAHKPVVSGLEEQPGKANYFIGKDPAKWRTRVSIYAKVRYREVYPGIDLVYYGNQRQLEYDFVVAPGADPNRIMLGFKGADKVEIDAEDSLVLHATGGDIRQHKPVIYQDIDGVRREIAGGYVRKGANRVGFQLPAYDTTRPLVIDPIVLSYSTYLGGSGDDSGGGIAVDADGNAYVAGRTSSPNFPTVAGAFQPTGGSTTDAFVAKLNPAGSALVYSTYIGGSDGDSGTGIAVDSAGNAYVTGGTNSANFPTTAGAFQTTFASTSDFNSDAFVAKLDSTGSSLVYSTYLGGGSDESGAGIAVDASGSAYVTGRTESFDFPTTPGAFQPVAANSLYDAFVTKFDAAGSALVYSTRLGGSANDVGFGIAVDAAGNAYVTGGTFSDDFPTTLGAFQATHVGGWDVFVTKFNLTGSALAYSTYLGGSGPVPQHGDGLDEGHGIAVDTAGNAYVTGQTISSNFPTTPGVFQPMLAGSRDVFVAKIVDVVPPPPPAPTSSGTTRSEESAATEIGFWTTYGAETGTFSGGSIVASNVIASTAMFSFTGTAVSWIGVKCNVCGIAAVSIDGGAPATVNTAGPGAPGSLTSEPVFSASGLAAGSHTMVIIVTGMSSSGGTYVALDAFDVTAGSATSPLLPPVVLPPPPVVVPPLPPIVGL